jgi:uncharacterized delta-60 repeat protein
VARFNAVGSLDTTFATPLLGGADYATGIAIQQQGHIVVSGTNLNTGTMDLVRYNTDGSIDTTFGTGGIVQQSLPGGAVQPFTTDIFTPVTPRMVITPGDKILTATTVNTFNPTDTTGYNFTLARFIGTETGAPPDVRNTAALDPTLLGADLGEVLVADAVDVALAVLSGSPTAAAQAQALVNGLADLSLYFPHK